MSVIAITPDYHGEMMDSVDKFHGKQLLNIGWDRHLLYASPMCVPVPPEMPFGGLIEGILPTLFGAHPDFERIKWDEIIWLRSGEAFTPDRAASLRDNGLGHKAILRMQTPGLGGIHGSGN